MQQKKWVKVVAWIMIILMVISLLPMAFIGWL